MTIPINMLPPLEIGNGKSPLTFEIRDAHQEKAVLVPYYQIHDERYVVYWKMTGR
jgi:hypothetical protein